MSVKVEKTVYEPFGNCVKLSNDVVELYVTVDVGPRVIRFNRVGMDNIFFEDHSKTPLDVPFDCFDGNQLVLLGGHRIWISPEITPRCYHPDNKPVTFTQVNESIFEFAGAVEELNGIQKIMRITLEEDCERVSIDNVIKNVGLWDLEFAPWCITMLSPGGVSVVPQTDNYLPLLPNRTFTLWAYSAMNDPRVYWGKDYITLRQDSTSEKPFKYGCNNIHGWAAYFNKGQAFFKFFEPVEDGYYPDNGSNYETYTNKVMLESETLGVISIVAPGEEVVQTEEWEIYEEEGRPSNDENEIRDLIDKYIEI